MARPVKIAIIVPTRNRPRIARTALKSLLEQDGPIDIFLSDNSGPSRLLEDFCRGHLRIRYLRPPRELSMPEHWDWAIGQALMQSDATHFSIHYDRKYSKPGAWTRLTRTARRNPDLVITFPNDFITVVPPPRRIWQAQRSDSDWLIDCRRTAELLAKGRLPEIGMTIPVLSNCIVPRQVLRSIADRFGSYCNSTGPDSAFMWRLLATHGQFIHHGHAPGILFAPHRSNGGGFVGGKGGDFADYLKMFGDQPWLDLAPIPGVNLGQNMTYHEHEVVRRQVGDRLPPLDRDGILADLATDLRWVRDPRQRRALASLLREQGWRGTEPAPLPRRTWEAIAWELEMRVRMLLLGERPFAISGFAFMSEKRALLYALRYPRQPEPDNSHLALLEPVELPAHEDPPRPEGAVQSRALAPEPS